MPTATAPVSRPTPRPMSPLARFVESLQTDPSGSTTYFLLLGLQPSDQQRITALSQHGVPMKILDRFQRTVGLSAERMAQLVQIPVRTLTRRRQTGRLRSDESGRLFLAAWVFARALALYDGKLGRAREWMESPQRGLGGTVPLTVAADPHGARLINDIIGGIEHGLGA
jgi:putative toxin-antitoxin system antitoxin component (TIGR02293 family)